MISDDLKKRIREFETKTIEAFHFLEKEYGYKRKKLKRKYFDYPGERTVSIQYFSKNVAVEIDWYIGDGNMAVGLYELQKGKIPENVSFYGHEGYARGINLDSLIGMITKGKVKSPIPRGLEKAVEMIRTDMGGILETFADRLKKYAHEILKGDTTIFPQVQKYHREFWGIKI
jgi:hypothetical protein